MKWFRYTLRKNRIFILTLLAVNVFHMVEGQQFVYAHQAHQKQEDRLREVSELLDIPVEKLRPDHESLSDSLREVFGVEPQDPVKAAGLDRLQEVVRKHEEQMSANPYLPRIEAVKNSHQIHRVEGMIQDLMRLTESVEPISEDSQRGTLRNLHHGLSQRVELPPLPEGLPTKARVRHAEMQEKLDLLFDSARPIVNSTQDAENVLGTIAQKVEQLRLFKDVETTSAARRPRFADRPLPIHWASAKARTEEVSSAGAKKRLPIPAATDSMPSPVRKVEKGGVAAEVVELAQSLDNSPARIFSYVHDNVVLDPKWGAVNGPLGALLERRGTAWDQAWLLRDLLTAAGVDARFEWGEVEIPADLLTDLTGLDDPFRAGDLLTTAGIPIVLLTQGSQVIGARMSHVWVRAFIDYIPNRGVHPGPGDTWVRMDPSLKRSSYADGIQLHDQVPFSLGEYLQAGTEESPRRAYEQALWGYIRANGIQCTTLDQLKPAGTIVREAFPFIPGTLRAVPLQLDGEATEVPEAFQHRVDLEVRKASGSSLLSWSAPWPELYGKKVEIAYVGATSEDQAILDASGGIFSTPPYLVDLKPRIQVGGVELASGAAIGSAEDVEIFVTLTPPGGSQTVATHRTYAGERHLLALDFTRLPQEILETHQRAQTAAIAAGDDDLAEAESLFLIGAQYMHDLGRDLADMAGWKWHRLLQLGTSGLISQTGTVGLGLDGFPLSFERGPRNVDIARMTLGLFGVAGDLDQRKQALELLGAQSSFLEGEVFSSVLQQEGIAAVSALTRSRRDGQNLTRVDSGNLNQVLDQIDLGTEVEQEIAFAVGQGKIAWVAESRIQISRWLGTGYVLEDPTTGAAAYLISGGFAGGEEVDRFTSASADLIGTEPWLTSGPLELLLSLLGEFRPSLGVPQLPGTNYGDPINLASGNMWITASDFLINTRRWGLEWRRFYNSRSDDTGLLGTGWSHSFGERLETQPDGSVLYREQDGTEHLFTRDAAGDFDAPPGKHLTLVEDASGFDLTTKEGFVSRFAQTGELLSVADRNGTGITLGYDALGVLQTVSDATGRIVYTFTVDDGRITRVTDFSGRSVSYQYDGDDLVKVIDRRGKEWSYGYDSSHNMIVRSDPLGNSNSYAYDSLDRCYQHIDPLGHEEMFFYPRHGESAVVRDRRGNDSFFAFDDRDRAVLAIDPLGNATSSAWDEDNNRVSIVDARGGTTTRAFDNRGNLLSEEVQNGNSITYSYDPATSQITTVIDHTGHSVDATYDAQGNFIRSTEVVDGETLVQEFEYDSFGQATSIRDPNGNTVEIDWNPVNGMPDAITDGGGNTTDLTTDDLGRVTVIDGPAGDVIELSWDEEDQLISSIDTRGNVTTTSYDDAGRPTSRTNDLGTITMTYDAAGRIIGQTDPLGHTVGFEYDPAGQLTARIDAHGNRTTMTYDAIGRPLAIIDPLGQVWSFGHCADLGCSGCSRNVGSAGDFCELTDPAGNTTRQEYDDLGRPTRIIDPLGNITSLSYDDQNRRRVMTDAENRTTELQYDVLGRLAAIVTPDTARTEFTYDRNGNLTRTRDAENRNWINTYDANNRLKTSADPLGNTTTFNYDAMGRVTSRVDPSNQELLLARALDLVTSVTHPNGVQQTLQYDTFGRQTRRSNAEADTSFEYDALGRVTAAIDHILGRRIDYRYDANGNLASMDGPQGEIEYFYDAKNRLVEQRDPRVGSYRFSYDALDRRQRLEYPNGVTTHYDYDAAGRLLSVLTRGPSEEIIDGASYTYDAVGRRTSRTRLRDGVTSLYEYDEINRLTRWQEGADRFEEYSYDRVGNRLELRDPDGVETYSYDLANRLLSRERDDGSGNLDLTNYQWDDNGNLLSVASAGDQVSYSYDALDRLINATDGVNSWDYGYGPDNIRVRETHNGSVRRFQHSFEDVVGTYDESAQPLSYYSHGPRIDEPLAQAGTGVEYLHHDALSSVTALTDASGQLAGTRSYRPFGQVSASSGADSTYGFTGRELDTSGLMYYRARYLDSETGRFTAKDPLGRRPAEQAGFNHYSYVRNNPISLVDPTGLVEWDCDFSHLAISFTIPGIFVGGGVGFILWNDCSSILPPTGGRWVTVAVFEIWLGITWGKLPVTFTWGSISALQQSSTPDPSGFGGLGWIFSAGIGIGLPIFPSWLSVYGYMVNAFNAFFRLDPYNITMAGPLDASDYKAYGWDVGLAFGIGNNFWFSTVWHPGF